MSLNIKPVHDRVVVEPDPAEQKSAGGIIIPDTAKGRSNIGTVVAVGPGKKDEPVLVKTGDKVLYGNYSGTEVTYEGKDYIVIKEADIFAVL